MAEMTTQGAIYILKHLARQFVSVGRHGSVIDIGEIAALIEQQAAEIAKKDKMMDVAVDKLQQGCCDFTEKPDCGNVVDCAACWLAWLEKEAEVQR
ncbi:MAG: hypothetical protein H6Q76_753 [Firmicutes bacterium]|nr:hypothetical protein [Bacillota bacterium]